MLPRYSSMTVCHLSGKWGHNDSLPLPSRLYLAFQSTSNLTEVHITKNTPCVLSPVSADTIFTCTIKVSTLMLFIHTH